MAATQTPTPQVNGGGQPQQPRENTALKKALASPLVSFFADKYGQSTDQIFSVLMSTVFPKDREGRIIATVQQFLAFLVVAKEYDLNPWTREIYAFPSKRGGVIPIVPIDGWVKLVNRPKDLDGVKFDYEWSEPDSNGKRTIFAITCKMKRKGMAEWVEVTEYFDECVMFDKRDNREVMKDTWAKWPVRMLRHKAYIQCARVAYGLAGIYDEDEAARIVRAEEVGGDPGAEIMLPQRTAAPTSKAPATVDADAAHVASQMTSQHTEAAEASPEPHAEPAHAEPESRQEEPQQSAAPASELFPEEAPQTEPAKSTRPEPKQKLNVPEDQWITPGQKKKLFAVLNSAKVHTEQQLYDHVWLEYGLEHLHQIPKPVFNDLLAWAGGDSLKIK